jgi:PAS domain S-box-containing protein
VADSQRCGRGFDVLPGVRQHVSGAVYENSTVGIALLDTNGTFPRQAEPRLLQRMFGYSDAELRHLAFVDLMPEPDRGPSRRAFAALFDGR